LAAEAGVDDAGAEVGDGELAGGLDGELPDEVAAYAVPPTPRHATAPTAPRATFRRVVLNTFMTDPPGDCDPFSFGRNREGPGGKV
jgi:hypothetical protein